MVMAMVFITPLSTLFQLYRGSQFYWWRKQEYRRKAPTYIIYHRI